MCQFAKDIVEVKDVTINATVEMKTKIDNRNLTEDLKNESSPAYLAFMKTFKEKMSKIYGHIEGYKDVNITELRQGSIEVDYEVLLQFPASSKVNETVNNISQNFLTAFKNYTECNETCKGTNCPFCFSTTKLGEVKVPGVEQSLCDRHIQEDFRSYYSPHLTATGVICITRCDPRHADVLPCVHGSCSVDQAGPQCECSNQATFWYQDKACRSRVSKMGVAVGVPVAVLVLVTTIFTILLLRSRRQKEQYREKLRSRSDLYSNDDRNWDNPQGFSMGNSAATWEDLETPGTTYIHLEKVDTSRRMHIQRPTMVH